MNDYTGAKMLNQKTRAIITVVFADQRLATSKPSHSGCYEIDKVFMKQTFAAWGKYNQ